MWKPRAEYKTLKETHKPILTRCKSGTGPMLVIWCEHGPSGAHFYPCPGIPIFYGNHQFGMVVHDHFDEWTELPD